MFSVTARISCALLVAVPFVPALLRAQATPSSIAGEIGKLRSLPDQQRPGATIKAAQEIASLPASMGKVELADQASQRVTEGDQGHNALQAVADVLSKALAETPLRTRDSMPPQPYFDLAQLARYEGVTVTLDDPLYKRANEILAADEAAVAKADFTLADLNHQTWTLSQLRGKIVLVNFWATWCPPCRAEMPVLDELYTQYQNQGLVVLSITDENPKKVEDFLSGKDYHPPVLTDDEDQVHNLFHVVGIPKTFVFDRDGKLAGIAIDQSTQKQFLALLGKAGLQPE